MSVFCMTIDGHKKGFPVGLTLNCASPPTQSYKTQEYYIIGASQRPLEMVFNTKKALITKIYFFLNPEQEIAGLLGKGRRPKSILHSFLEKVPL